MVNPIKIIADNHQGKTTTNTKTMTKSVMRVSRLFIKVFYHKRVHQITTPKVRLFFPQKRTCFEKHFPEFADR